MKKKTKKLVIKKIGWKELAGIAGLLLFITAGINSRLVQKNKKLSEDLGTRIVKEVLDGDTFVAEDNVIVRLVSVEAPEMEFCGGEKAKKALKEMILGKRVRLEVQVRDSYGRLVALTYKDDKLINEKMLADGWAFYSGANSFAKEKLMIVGREARGAKRGIFGPECTQEVNLDQPKCLIKGNYDATDAEGSRKIYHFPGCGRYDSVAVELYRGDKWFCSEQEAQSAGFVKSGNCFGREFSSLK